MIICFIGPAHSSHIIKWCNWFTNHGHEVHVISFRNALINNTTVHFIGGSRVNEQGGDIQKIRYLFNAKKIRKIVEQINPDVVNVHFATSYGAATALSGLKNYILSVWGTDVYEFPRKSPFHKILLKYSLSRAAHIFSTSQAMAEVTKLYTNKSIDITPFGVDMSLFNPDKRTRKDETDFIIGTVKTLQPKYGIDYLLKAAAYVKNTRPDITMKVRIAGKGTSENELKKLADDLKISNITEWLGFISQEEASRVWANMDVAVVASISTSESFGVSAVEAEASGVPVIISDVPGLMESTKPGVSSIVVPRKNEIEIGKAIIFLYDHPDKRMEMSITGRQFALDNFELNCCFEKIEKLLISLSNRYPLQS